MAGPHGHEGRLHAPLLRQFSKRRALVQTYQRSNDSERIGPALLAVDAEILCVYIRGLASARQSPVSNLKSWRGQQDGTRLLSTTKTPR